MGNDFDIILGRFLAHSSGAGWCAPLRLVCPTPGPCASDADWRLQRDGVPAFRLRCNRRPGDADADTGGAGPAAPTRPQILIDTRNHYETAVGTFKGAIDPKIRTFAQFPGWVSEGVSE